MPLILIIEKALLPSESKKPNNYNLEKHQSSVEMIIQLNLEILDLIW